MDKTTVEKCLVTLSIEHQWNGHKTGGNIFIVFFFFFFQMKIICTLFCALVLLDITKARNTNRKCNGNICKTNENSQAAVEYRACGDQISDLWYAICKEGISAKRQQRGEYEKKSYLSQYMREHNIQLEKEKKTESSLQERINLRTHVRM